MPLPAYLMFTESGSVDQHTHRVSLFGVVEVISVVARIQGSESPPAVLRKQRITSVWLREPSDTEDDAFEFQVACLSPDGTELFQGDVVPFHFKAHFHRFDVVDVQMLGFVALGIHFIEGRLRRSGQDAWEWRHNFPFVVQENPNSKTATDNTPE